MLPRPQLAKPCLCYKKRCLACRTSKSLVKISQVKKKNTQKPLFPSEVRPFSKPFHTSDPRDIAFCENVSASDMICDSDDNDKEITIICNIKHNEVIPRGTKLIKGSVKIKATCEEANLYQLFYAHDPLRH